MPYLRQHINLAVVIILALVFFGGTASFNFLAQDDNYKKWSSPDETANYFFAKSYAETGKLALFDRAGVVGDYLLMPRSVRNDFGWIKPVSFLGIILIYGSLAAAFKTAIIPFLTPLFAAGGIIIFYLLVRRLLSERVALWSAFILAFFPVYIYYTVRSMFHNVLFIVLLLAGIYLLVLSLGPTDQPKRRFLSRSLPGRYWLELLASLGGGLFIGAAVITRTSEILWLAPALFLAWLFYARRLGLAKLILFLAGAAAPLVPVAYYNQILYNSFWYGGYNEMNRSLDDIAESGRAFWNLGRAGDWLAYIRLYWQRIFDNVFYFGFNARQSVVMVKHYIFEMFPVLVYAGLMGLILYIVQNVWRPRKKYLIVLLVWLGVSAFLVFYYGSWQFNDNPDLTRFTIGNSYTRYWLPIYLGFMPLAALALVRVSRALFCAGTAASVRWSQIGAFGLQAVAILAFAAWSLNFVLFGSEEGLAHLYYINKAEKINTERVWALTEPDAVIITRYHDKFFWPERRVIMGTFPNDEIFAAVVKLVRYYPVYYYNFYLPAVDLNYLNERRLVPYGLRLELVQKLNGNFGLYRLASQPTFATEENGQEIGDALMPAPAFEN